MLDKDILRQTRTITRGVMNDNKTQDELDDIEEQLKEKDEEEEKTHQKVSGKSVFEIQKIIINKGRDRAKNHRDKEDK